MNILNLAVGLGLAIIVGLWQYKLRDGKIYRRCNERFFKLIASLSALAVYVFLIKEYGEAVVTFCDGNIISDSDDPAWSIIIMIFIMAIIAMVWAGILYKLAIKIGQIRFDYLIAKRLRNRQETETR